MIKRKPKRKDEDPVDELDAEITKISKKLAETHKTAMAKLTSARRKPAQPDQAPPGFKKFKSKWKGANQARKGKCQTGMRMRDRAADMLPVKAKRYCDEVRGCAISRADDIQNHLIISWAAA